MVYLQVRTVGYDRFLHAGRCTGTHLHLDLPDGVIDPRVGVSYDVSAAAREELLNIYNLATALDAGLIALSRACPFYNSADRVRRENLTVRPAEGVRTFELSGNKLSVPDFKYLDRNLLYAAVTEGVKNLEVTAYLDSILEFVVPDGGEGSNYLAKLRSSLGKYQTTEAEILQEFAPATGEISRDEGLQLVRQCCDKLEKQVSFLYNQSPLAVLEAKTG